MSLFHRHKPSPDPDLVKAKAEAAQSRAVANKFRAEANQAYGQTLGLMARINEIKAENHVRQKLHKTFGGP